MRSSSKSSHRPSPKPSPKHSPKPSPKSSPTSRSSQLAKSSRRGSMVRQSSTGRRGSVVRFGSQESIEDLVRQSVSDSTRENNLALWEYQQESMVYEEDPSRMEELMNSGLLSVDDAHKLNARRIMHDKRSMAADMAEASAAAVNFETTEAMLEVVLDDGAGVGAMRYIRRKLGIQAFLFALAKERKRRSHPDFENPLPCLAWTVQSAWFESCMGLLMIVNAIFIGIDTSAEDESTHFWLFVAEHTFTAVFVVELGLRVVVHGWTWIWDILNAIDFSLIVLTGVLPMWILWPAGVDSSSMRVVQVIRVLRLVRLVRMFRTNRHLRMPYKLTQGLFESGPTLVHAYAVVGTLLCILAVFSVYLLGRSPVFEDGSDQKTIVEEKFGTVPKAVFTLFTMMTLDSWTSIVRPLAKETSIAWFFFVFVIMLMTLVLQNLITAVIVNNALERLKKDADLIAAEKREQKQNDMGHLRTLYYSLDLNQNNLLTKEEFGVAVKTNPKVGRRLMGMNILVEEAEEIWDLFGANDGQGITERQFSLGMRSMQGEALAKHSFASVHQLRRINHRIERLKAELEGTKDVVDKLREEVANVRKDLCAVLHEVHQFVRLASVCVPEGPVERSKSQILGLEDKRVVQRDFGIYRGSSARK